MKTTSKKSNRKITLPKIPSLKSAGKKQKCALIKQVLLTTALLLLNLLLLLSCSKNAPTDAKQDQGSDKPSPSGAIYFSVSGKDSLFYLNTINLKFSALKIEIDRLIDFTVSQDGNALIFADGQKIKRFDLLNRRITFTASPQFLPTGSLSCNHDGTLIAYETTSQARRQIALLYVDGGANFLFNASEQTAAYSPMITPSGQNIVWTQNDGLYYSRILKPYAVRLWKSSIAADDFSPSESYLSADGLIFDLKGLTRYPGTHGGKLKFIDDYKLVWNPANSSALKKITLSGSQETHLFQTANSVQDFAVAEDQRFVAAVSSDYSNLIFTLFDFVDMQKEFELKFPSKDRASIKKIVWSPEPSSLSHND
ncbi:MAG: hypothetical protein GXO77_07225 [Calditrichaeota bacterium]|nr:hypothetical protein [Calditrichota bacterium]